MRIVDVEVWALRVLERVRAGQRVEDARVELKGKWPVPSAAARRIAGLANAAGGSDVLWLVGVDETTGVVPHPPQELANWWPKVRSEFDEVAPELTDVVIHTGHAETVTALCFSTDRAPYLVKNPEGGTIQREVPWREGTSLRSARRSDLIRILVPLQAAPTLEIVSAELNAWLRADEAGPKIILQLQATAYFTAGQGTYAVFPFRHMKVSLTPEGLVTSWSIPRVYMRSTQAIGPVANRPSPTRLQTVHDGVEQLIVQGHGYAWLTGNVPITVTDELLSQLHQIEAVDLTLSLTGVGLSTPVSANVVLAKGTAGANNQVGAWQTTSREP